ncbi:MAG: hypothetical protein HY815_06285 [Candidatus Riflebacteria bacterium]|nr:hypothetical protein [Candidatus Riflebacteria bacterium]
MPLLTRSLARFFLLILVVGGILFAVHDYQVSSDLADRLKEEQVATGKRQVNKFSDEVRRTLERYQFKELIDKTRGQFLQFEKLSETLLSTSEYISYIHWKNDRGETLLFKGPDTLQQFIINERGVTYYQSTTSEVREIRVDRPGRIDKITDITTPILTTDRKLGSVSIGLDEEKIRLRAQEAASRVRTRTILYSSVGVGVLGLVFFYVSALVTKVTRLSRVVEHQSRMAYVGTLASGLVHEIRNPLNGINLNLAVLEEELGEGGDARTAAALSRILGRIRPNLAHLENISTEFLMFAKPPKLALVATSLNDVVTETAQFLRPQCEASRVSLELSLDPQLPRTLLDREKVRQVLLNLAVNAIQASPKGGTLTFATARAGKDVELSVRDTGSGIAPEARKKLFSLFFSTKEHGVGLGLPIVKRLVEDHGGEITVESVPGAGTTMRIRLPVRARAQDPEIEALTDDPGLGERDGPA